MKKILIFCFFFGFGFMSIFSMVDSYKTIFAPGISFPGGTEEKFKRAFIEPENYCVAQFNDMDKQQSYWNQFVSWLASWIGEPLYNRDCCLGQSRDIEAIKKCSDQAKVDEKIVLFGLCRGAAACLNYQAKYNDPRVKAIVIDSGVFDVKKAYKKLAPKCIGIKKVFPCFPQNALEPIDAIANIENKTIKILLMHANKDAVISYDQALEFVQKCLKLGFDAQLIPFDSDQHCKIFKEKPDQYLTVVDQWYKKLK